MAHDVAGYDEVLVGEDQGQHLQFARHLLKNYNRSFDENLTIPKERIVVGRIKDLKHPENKMSKSSPAGCLFLDDTPEDIRRKVKKATMNEEGRKNMEFLYSYFVEGKIPEMNVELKERLGEALVKEFSMDG